MPESGGNRLRNGIKSTLEGLMGTSLGQRVNRSRGSGKGAILAYHNVVPDDEEVTGEASLHLPLARFREHLDVLAELTSVVPLAEAARSGQQASPGSSASTHASMRVALTFDDAYIGVLRHALPELARRNMPCTIFVPSALVGTEAFWWDAVPMATAEEREYALEALHGDAESICAWAAARNVTLRVQGANQRPCTIHELKEAARIPGVQLGVHTMSHRNLATLTEAEITHELLGCRDWLQARGLEESGWVAYPYGRTSDAAAGAARALQFQGALLVDGGVVKGGEEESFATPRLSIPSGATAGNLQLHLFGWLPS